MTDDLIPDRDVLLQFVGLMFKNANPNGFVSLRAFRDNDKRDEKPILIEAIRLDDPDFAAVVVERARQAATWDDPAVYCPPAATFKTPRNAKTDNLCEGVDLSAECDQSPRAARATLEALLGPATAVVESGGDWINPATGEIEPKVHLHWRLKTPTSTKTAHDLLKEARTLAANLVGADGSNKSVVHPIRWPGSWHRKKTPRLATIVAFSDSEIDLNEAIEILRDATGTAAFAGFGFKTDSKLCADDHVAVASALAVIPNEDLEWDHWNRIGMATWAATDGSPIGLSAFAEWSSKSKKNDPAATEARWQHYRTSPPTRIGFGTLVWLARKHSPGWTYKSADKSVAEDEAKDLEIAIEITRLAKLPVIKYEQERKAAAELFGFRASILDRAVEAERARLGLDDKDAGLQGRAISFPEPEPWPEPVSGAKLLDEIAAEVKRYVIMDEQASYSTALWVEHTYLLDAFMISPRLAVRSPMKRCGKTTLLDVLGCLVMKALPTANVSAAAVFRVVEGYRPCLLVDEADTFLAESDDLRGVLNSGHRRGGSVLRTVGDDHEPRAFATYSAVAIGIIGALPDTLADRSIQVVLKRKLVSEATESFRIDRVGHLEVLARKVARWAADNAEAIAKADPEMPPGVHSRAADNWRPLFAIADVAGGEWPKRARAAASQVAAEGETESMTELLLGDIRDAFASREADKVEPPDQMPSGVLVDALVEIEGRPWAELGKSRKPLTQNGLARRLKPLGIGPDYIGPETARARGYKRDQFDEAFGRYLGISNCASVQNVDKPGTSCISQVCSPDDGCTVGKSKKPNNDGLLHTCTVGNGDSGEEQVSCAENAPSDAPDLIPEDRTCARCRGEIDGTERFVSVSSHAAWVHLECQRFWVRDLKER